jgi:DNA-binding MarR family transcriptional regulator
MFRTQALNEAIYGAFAATRLALSRDQMEVSLVHDPHRRFWFARFEMYIALLMMMDNRYAAHHDSDTRIGTRLTNLISNMPCSYTTARQLIDDAVELGYLEMTPSQGDRRVKMVIPTERTIALWESYVDEARLIMKDTGLIAPLSEHAMTSA